MRDDISTRLRARQRTGDPGALWPRVSDWSRTEAHRRIAAVTRAVLNRTESPPRVEVDGNVSPAAWSVAAYVSGMGPLLGHWLATGSVEGAPALAQLLREHLDHNARRAATMEAALLRILDAFASARITCTLLKGAHTSRVYFPTPATRPATDIDLLVPPAQFQEVCAALRTAGFAEVRRTARPWRSEWMAAGQSTALVSLELDHAENPWSIDLHQSLDRWYFRGLRAGFEPALWKTVPLDTDGRRVQVLAQPLLTAFLAMHAAFGVRDLRLIHLVELVFVIRRDAASGTLRWQDLAELLTATQTARFVYPALELAERLAPDTVDPGMREDLTRTSTARMRRVIEAIDGAGMRLPRRSLDERLMWACGIRELLCNIGELVWPSDQALPATEIARLYLRRARMLVRGQIGLRSQAR